MSQSRRRGPRKRPRVALFYMDSNKGILLGIARYVREHGPWAIYRQPSERLEVMPSWLARWEGDGVIGRILNREAAELVRSTGLPFVDICGAVRAPDIPLVHGDDAAVGELAAEHLLERGFRHFGYYGAPGEIWSDERYEAFERAVTAAEASCQLYRPARIVSGPSAWDEAEEHLAEWLTKLPRPAAVMGANDDLGERVLGAARRAGIRVPDELAVIGVDDDRAICEVCDPPLSSVTRDFEFQGYKAAELLDRLMAGEAPPTQPLFVRPSGVCTRQSTDVLAIDDPFIVRAVSFIRRHACDGIGVSDVLREVPLSRSVLQRRFRRILGQTVSDAIIHLRVKRAQQLLTETDLPLSKVAEMAGFQHHQYLGAVFRKRLGVSPARYRKGAAAAGNGRKG